MGAIKGVHAAKAGHPGGSLSAADLFTYLYFKNCASTPRTPKLGGPGSFRASKGHTAPGLRALALRGFFPEEDLLTLGRSAGKPSAGATPT